MGNNQIILTENGVTRTWELVQADSERAAIYKAIRATAGIEDYYDNRRSYGFQS